MAAAALAPLAAAALGSGSGSGNMFEKAFGAGTKEAAQLVKEIDFSKMRSNTSEETSSFTYKLAPSFGNLTDDSIKKMDESLKFAMAVTCDKLELQPDKSWEAVLGVMSQNTMIEEMPSSDHRVQKVKAHFGGKEMKTDTLKKDFGVKFFNCDGDKNEAAVSEVMTWFRSFIGDEDILTATGIDIGTLAKIVAETGAVVNSFESVFASKSYKERIMLDIGVLRYPDIEHPYFKLYRIKMKAWSDCTRVLMVEQNHNGITGEFSLKLYQPRESFIKEVSGELKKEAVASVEDDLREMLQRRKNRKNPDA